MGSLIDLKDPGLVLKSWDGAVYSSVYEYMFQTDNTKLGSLTSLPALAVSVVLIMMIRGFKRWFKPIMCDVGRSLGRKRYGKEWEAKNEVRIVKFGEYCFRLLYHFSMAC